MKLNSLKRIKAFTLSEMIVVLVITIIVIGLAFSVLNLVQKQMSGIQQNYEQGTEVNLLRQALWVDFRSYSTINYNAKSDILSFENEVGVMEYQFDETTVIRDLDTLKITITDKMFYFDGNEVSVGEIDAIKILTKKEEGAKVIFVYKNNTAQTYLK
ncbi:hypothetical protein [Cellulophaga sp. Hel_I_12]|uniref:hypothetical protein n=1 Tax=Cellulophaga sp. Hel_I_12 TaxID=1249972 RepID=UPI000646EA9C|nr:hypothetical protein [Cellulophaga sp. Hel_I_12]